MWILLIFIYATLKGLREGMKKAAVRRNETDEILFFYTLTSLILILPFSGSAFSLSLPLIGVILIKSTVVCLAWLCSFTALRSMPVSLFGIMDLLGMVFASLFGTLLLNEVMTLNKALGMLLVIIGLTLVNLKKDRSGSVSAVVMVTAILSTLFNSISGTMDKVLMKYMSAQQLQFWFILFMTLIYGASMLIKREKISFRRVAKNYWIPLMSVFQVIGDRVLFEANADPASQVIVMTVVKQSSVIVTVLTGWLIFKEKNILYKLVCTAIVLAGIVIAVL